ncbi:MAG: hypothetical protein IT376_02560 [Polyangiaceae bacterium]|nr:hypothetical protein [Polyangiaceae bacterium]
MRGALAAFAAVALVASVRLEARAETELPAGHPPARSEGDGAESDAAPPRVQDSVTPSARVPAGGIDVELLDAAERPVGGREVRLGMLRQSVSEGDRREQRTAAADPEGIARFRELAPDGRMSYRVTVLEGKAEYASQPFSLGGESGVVVRLHVLPVTSDLRRALVGMRGTVYVEPRDDVFAIEVLLDVFNVGRSTWVPEGVAFALPPGAKAFAAPEGETDARAVADGPTRVALRGTYTPGQHPVTFRFQLPNAGGARLAFELGLPPHVAEMRVMAEAPGGATLSARAVPRAPAGGGAVPLAAVESMTNARGQRVLVASRQLRQGDPELGSVVVELAGLPARGDGRWWAVGLAGLVAVVGVAGRRRGAGPVEGADLDAAERVLVREVARLDAALAGGAIGPRSHEAARRELVAAVARLRAQRRREPAAGPGARGEAAAGTARAVD